MYYVVDTMYYVAVTMCYVVDTMCYVVVTMCYVVVRAFHAFQAIKSSPESIVKNNPVNMPTMVLLRST